ncbi:MAG: amidase [Planctomycetaceae bacterium]
MNLFPPDEVTIAGIGRALRDGSRTCVDVVGECLARIDERDAEIRAWVSVDRHGALDAARRVDLDLAAGRDRGPLHGVPIGVKDIFDVAGWPTAAGSPRLAKEARPAERDSEAVARLRAAGAVILGKTVTTQFASFDPAPTRNPWKADRTPGGSSSGSAAAVALGMCAAALGSQTGGSVTRPASYCGVAGVKPSFGLVSRRGVFPLADSLDHVGAFARTVDDLGTVLEAIGGYDQRDPASEDGFPFQMRHVLNSEHGLFPTLGRLRGMFEEMADDETRQALDHALERLKDAGALIQEVEPPTEFDDVLARHRMVMAVEAAAVHEDRLRRFPEDYLPNLRSLIEEGMCVSAVAFARTQTHRRRLTRAMDDCFENVDLLVCPATTGPPPDAATTGDPAFNSPWSYTGLATVSFPIALSGDGLPLALQLVARTFDETNLFRIARWCERALRPD